jgi:hypothetical protein
MSNLYRGPSINASYQVSIHLANQKQELAVAAMFVNGLRWNEQSL